MSDIAAVLLPIGAGRSLAAGAAADPNVPSDAVFSSYGYADLSQGQIAVLNGWSDAGGSGLFVSVYDRDGAFAFSKDVAASPPEGPDQPIGPSLFSLADGDLVVTWQDKSATSDQGRFALLAPSGQALTNGATALGGSAPDIGGFSLPGGGFQLNWTTPSGVQSQVYDEQGRAVANPVPSGPVAYAAGAGGAYLQVLDNQVRYFDGGAWASALALPGEAAHAVTSEAVASLSGGGMASIWTDASAAHIALYNPARNSLTAVTLIDVGPSSGAHILALPDGGFAVSWTEGGQIKGEAFDSAGDAGPSLALTGDLAGIDGAGEVYTLTAAPGGYIQQDFSLSYPAPAAPTPVYLNYLGQVMPVSASPLNDITHSLHGPWEGGATLYAPQVGPAGVAANGGGNTIIASNGDNSYWIGPTDTVVVPAGETGTKTIYAWNAEVLPEGVNNLTFYGAANWGIGNSGANLIVMGGNDQNYMDGAGGDDVLVGGFGQNNIGFDAGSGGNDVVYNFHPWIDTVRIAGGAFTSFAQIQSAMTQVGSDVVLKVDANESITFRDIQISDFTPHTFLLPLDASKLGSLTFDDEFNNLQLLNTADGSGHWRTNFGGSTASPDTYFIGANQEKQVYTDASFQGTSGHPLGYDPFSVSSDGVLGITAQRFSYADSQYTFGQAYSSGMLNTKGLFEQQYGYFEMRAQLPTTLGTWPAFWLAQDPFVPGNEADVLEHLALAPNTAYVRSNDNGYVQGTGYYMPDPSGMHTYGMLWTPDTTTFYVDKVAVMQLATPASWNQPMYMILNLAIGGWGGPIDSNGLPAQMNVDYVRVYGLADNAQVVDNMTAANGYVSIGASSYTAPAGVSTVNLVGSNQTIIGNDAGDTFISNDTGNRLIGGIGADTFLLGRAGDTASGGAGADTFVYREVPWSSGQITDFSGGDIIDLSKLMTSIGYLGADPVADGYLKIQTDGAGQAQIWVNSDPGGSAGVWWLVTTLAGVAPTGLSLQGDLVTSSAPASAPPAGVSVSTSAQSYAAPSGVTTITLTGSGQTVTGNNAGDMFVSNNTGNHLIGGSGADIFQIGRGGDIVTGGAGADSFVFKAAPWASALITDFSSQDSIDLTGLLQAMGFAGSDPIGSGYLKVTSDGQGGSQIAVDLDKVSAGAGWWVAADLSEVAPTQLSYQQGRLAEPGFTPPAPGPTGGGSAVSTGAPSYTAPPGVTSITLTGSAQTVTGNDSGDTFISNNSGNHLIGGAGDDHFGLGRGGDVAAGGSGADHFVFDELPWAGGRIVDFSAQDSIDLTGMLAKIGYSGADPIGAGYLKITADGAGGSQIWADLDAMAPGAGWWLVTGVDSVAPASLTVLNGTVTQSVASPPAEGQSISTSAASYAVPGGVTSITLTGSAQTVTGNNAGDIFVSNNTGNHLIGGSGADTFIIGRGGDVVSGGAGSDSFMFNEVPWAGGHITDFSAQDHIDLTGMLSKLGYAGSDPVADGVLKITADGAGGAQLWADLDPVSPGAGWWLATTIDHQAPVSLHLQGAFITG